MELRKESNGSSLKPGISHKRRLSDDGGALVNPRIRAVPLDRCYGIF
ncbi:MAG: hypothetical protein ABFC57_11855 [Veillonellales bacterium]